MVKIKSIEDGCGGVSQSERVDMVAGGGDGSDGSGSNAFVCFTHFRIGFYVL
jgi:hypothetical protein